ncbi:MAG: putative two-component system response regulator [Fibrobacteres bacterium]|nr:putative two-component system response regulator [Fibrobacterota bacterium]
MNYSEKPVLLVVEDSRVLAKVIEQRLSPFFRVEMAHDGEEAMRSLSGQHGFAAVVLDLVLPKADGFEVLRMLRGSGQKIPVIIATAKPRQTVESDAKEFGVDAILAKPLDFPVLIDILQQAISKNSVSQADEAMENKATGRKYPFRIARKYCFICGYEKVQVFLPIKDAYTEEWNRGSAPMYHSKNGYEEWDMLKTLVMVCPYCFFASSDPADFADSKDSPYPYSEESKKILARSISIRKRLVPEALDIDPRFDHPHRDRDTVMFSLILAEKCSNGLILAGKPGAYCQAGVFTTLQGALNYWASEKYFREGLTSFENQLKHKETPRRVLVRTYFFCIVLNMLLNRTIVGRDIMKKVEELYADARYEEISEEEREWLMRINLVWKNGCGSGAPREIV